MSMFYEIITDNHIPKLAELYVETYNAPPWNDEWTVGFAAKRLDEMINCRDSYGLLCLDDSNGIVGLIVGNIETYYNCKQFFIKDFSLFRPCSTKGLVRHY